MKKLSIVCLTIITCLSLASFTPSLDGKARIAISDEFPRGLFARAKGYFPGDTINVTNLITEKTCEVLVVGTLLQDENVSLLLSYEAGLALGIGPLQEIFVKLAKRAGQFDERVSSVAIISRVLGDNFAFNTESNSSTQEQSEQDISSEQAESKIDEKNFEEENFLVEDNSLLSEDDFTNPNF
ncbi:MAG: hypothetical protein IJR49_01145, partial [Treponema sp.]|nr:hypothetical protein [Treponema sp.]